MTIITQLRCQGCQDTNPDGLRPVRLVEKISTGEVKAMCPTCFDFLIRVSDTLDYTDDGVFAPEFRVSPLDNPR